MLNTPTPGFASQAASNLTSIHRSMSSRQQQVPSPNMTDLNISVDGSEAHRRSLESDMQRNLSGKVRKASQQPAFQSFDENSPRYGDNPRSRLDGRPRPPYSRRARVQSGSSSETEESDTASLHIALNHQTKGPGRAKNSSFQPSHKVRISDDLSSIHTASPQKHQPSMMSQESPVSGFDGMAKELRKEFERIGARGGLPRSSATFSPGQSKHIESPSRTPIAARPVLGEIGNTVLTAQRPADGAKSARNATFLPAETPAPVRYSDIPFPSSPPQSAYQSRAYDSTQPARNNYRSTSSPFYQQPNPRREYDAEYHVPDITGVTDALASPEKAMGHRRVALSTHSDDTSRTAVDSPPRQYQPPPPQFEPPTPRPASRSTSKSDRQLQAALAQLEARLNALEDENGHSAERVKDLEAELGKKRTVSSGYSGAPDGNEQWKHARGSSSKSQQEELVDHLQAHVARLTKSLALHTQTVTQLKESAAFADEFSVLRREVHGWSDQIETLKDSVETLSKEIEDVKSLIASLNGQKPRPNKDHIQPVIPGSHSRPSYSGQHSDPLPAPKARPLFRPIVEDERPRTAPLPEAHEDRRGLWRHLGREGETDPDLQRAEAILRSVPTEHDDATCRICQHRNQHSSPARTKSASPKLSPRQRWSEDDDEGFAEGDESTDSLPPQTYLARALRDLEEDFASHKAIYNELSEAYKRMDPASKVTKRRTLAAHLKESIDVLESKADQIKRLYDLLHYQSHPDAVPYLQAGKSRY